MPINSASKQNITTNTINKTKQNLFKQLRKDEEYNLKLPHRSLQQVEKIRNSSSNRLNQERAQQIPLKDGTISLQV